MNSKKKQWFSNNAPRINVAAKQSDSITGMLMYSELVEDYLEVFPEASFNLDYAEYLKE